MSIDPTARLAEDCRIVAETIRIDEGARVESGVVLTAGEVRLARGAQIRADARITAVDSLRLGVHGVLGPGLRAVGRRLDFGAFFWSTNNVTIGGGGSQGPDAVLQVGESTSFFDRAFVNVSEPVAIGSGCALSADTTILTHGCWQPVLEGFPFLFASVTLESDVVVYVKSVILPGVTLGRGTAVAAGSVVTKSAPPYSLLGGVPARILRSDIRRHLTASDRLALVRHVLERYAATLAWKGLEDAACEPDGAVTAAHRGVPVRIVLEDSPLGLVVSEAGGRTVFDLETLQASGAAGPVAEDLRDFLRRCGIKVATGAPFRSLPPARLAALHELARADANR